MDMTHARPTIEVIEDRGQFMRLANEAHRRAYPEQYPTRGRSRIFGDRLKQMIRTYLEKHPPSVPEIHKLTTLEWPRQNDGQRGPSEWTIGKYLKEMNVKKGYRLPPIGPD
jgi:hypothetical protein